jgi:hypothetical protein
MGSAVGSAKANDERNRRYVELPSTDDDRPGTTGARFGRRFALAVLVAVGSAAATGSTFVVAARWPPVCCSSSAGPLVGGSSGWDCGARARRLSARVS